MHVKLPLVIHPHAHVEGDDGDSDVLGGLPVDVRELQPGVVLLLPRLQGVSGYERRSYRRGQSRQMFTGNIVTDHSLWCLQQN